MRKQTCKSFFGVTLVAGFAATAQERDHYRNWGREAMEQVRDDLNRAARDIGYLSEEESRRFRRVREAIFEFQRDWEQGRFDREALNDAIRNLQGVIERNRLQPRDRDYLTEDVARLRRIRERYEGRVDTEGGGPRGAQWVGCFVDRDRRDLPAAFIDGNMSVGRCVAHCAREGFTYAGVQDGNQCFCGNSYGAYGASRSCNTPCSANSSERCGGVWANGVYRVR